MNFNVSINRQQGVALITVLLVFFISSLLAVSMLDRQQLDIHRSENALNQSQLFLYLDSAEETVEELLWNDFVDDEEVISRGRIEKGKDALEDSWNTSVELDLSSGKITLTITDMQALFNINSLVRDDRIDPVAAMAFDTLLKNIGVTSRLEINDLINLRFEEGRLMSHLSELKILPGVTPEDFDLLVDCLVVLPADTSVNINTASTVILQAWEALIVPNQRDDILLERQRNHGLNSLPELPGDLSFFSISSEYFRADIEIEFQDKKLYSKTVVHRNRDTGIINIIGRDVSRFKSGNNQADAACSIVEQ